MAFQKSAETKPVSQLKPLDVKCTHSRCGDGLHCFKAKSKKAPTDEKGKCRECGIDLIDWTRVHNKDLNDVEFTFQMLKYELVRHVYWHSDIDIQAINYGLRKGRIGLRKRAEEIIENKLPPKKENPYDGRQTKQVGNIIYYAQHATGCCCRDCIEYWHNIPCDNVLNEEQKAYFVNLIMLYIEDRMSEIGLQDVGIKVPKIKREELPVTTQKTNH